MNLIPPSAEEYELMGLALREAQNAARAGEIPVGAIVTDPHGTVIGVGANTRVATADPTGHAEIVAILQAAQSTGDYLLEGCTLFVTLEPCVMCAGVILASRIPRVVFGAWDEKAGAVGSVYDLLRDGRLPSPVPEVIVGVRATECAAVLSEFFAQRR